MENKINVAELLRDCPSGMELDCTMYDNLYFDGLDIIGNIKCYIKSKDGCLNSVTFHKNGCYNTITNAKCVIFPKGKTTWEGFHRPFKDGDVCHLKTKYFEYIFIFKVSEDYNYIKKYVNLSGNNLYIDENAVCPTDNVVEIRFATEEEKEKLFQAIKDNGYRWNDKTKNLEKLRELKFKIGDRIKKKGDYISGRITQIDIGNLYKVEYCDGGVSYINSEYQDNYELVPNKFDINTLVPFESRVLVRDEGDSLWQPSMWGIYDEGHNYPYITIGNRYRQCIPYEGNEHLLCTRNDCENYYKTWNK